MDLFFVFVLWGEGWEVRSVERGPQDGGDGRDAEQVAAAQTLALITTTRSVFLPQFYKYHHSHFQYHPCRIRALKKLNF